MRISLILYRVSMTLFGWLLLVSYAYSQGYRKLAPSDFKGKPNNEERYLSNTKLRIGYSSTAAKKGNVYLLTFRVYLDINKAESWMKFDKLKNRATLETLLNHEQGHFKIGALMQRELMQKLNAKRYSSHHRQEAATIFNKVSNKYQLLQLQYDEETRHMMDTKRQDEWNEKLDRSLRVYGIDP